MIRLIPSIIAVLLASLSVQAKERISILDFMVSATAKKAVNVDVSQDLTQQVRDVATSLIDPARFEVMTRENILVMLPPGKKNLAECEGQCEVETARNLGSRWHVVGDVKKVGTKLVLSVRLYDVASGTQLGGVRMDGATVDEVNATVSPKARELLARIPGMKGASAGDAAIANSGGAEPVGSRADAAPVLDEVGSIVTVSVFGGAATFALDGKSVCRDQETCQQELSHGKHLVKVGRSGYRDTVFAIVVPRGNNTYSLGLNPKLGVVTLRAQDEATGQALVASILIDGKEAGMTPKSLSVPLSVREIRLREKDHEDLVVTERPEQEGGKVALNLKMVRQKVSVSETVPPSSQEAASPSTTSPSERKESAGKSGRNGDCIALDRVKAEKAKLMEQVNAVNQQGKLKKAECESVTGAAKDRCMDEIKPLRAQIAALSSKMAPLNDDIQKFSALCPESVIETRQTLGLYEKVASETCSPVRDQKRCEDALFNMADISYRIDNSENLAARQRYERDYDAWKENGKRDKEPRQSLLTYDKGLAAHLRYLNELPQGSRRDVILYRTAFIYDLMGRSADAFPFLMEISRRYPASRQIAPTNLRIGEFYFVDKNFDSAIVYYDKVNPNTPGNEGVLGLALYHKAEAMYEKARYQAAADAFFDYVERADKGLLRGDLRTEAILYMGSCFAEFSTSYNGAKKYFAIRGGRGYEDTLFYELALKHADREQYDLAIPALEYFLKTFSDYYKAPLAQIKLVEILEKKGMNEEAQLAREEFVQRFDRSGSWWRKPRKFDKKELTLIETRLRDWNPKPQ